jgi:L-alanine-DL-glutamate epimerase-like enolase superfamily enzyme
VGKQWNMEPRSYGATQHQFTQVQITPKGLEEMAKYVVKVRDVIGFDVPLASDHYGHFDMNNAIRLGRALDPYRLARRSPQPSRRRPIRAKIYIAKKVSSR